MIVVAIIGLMVSAVTFGVNALPRARLRTSCIRLAATFRFAYLHALATGHTSRVSFRLGAGQLSVEDTDDTHTLDRDDPMHAGGAADVEVRARDEARLMAEMRPRATRAVFTALPTRMFNVRPLEDGVAIVRLFSDHDPEPRVDGAGHIYFFSGGQTEHAILHVRNTRGDTFSVVLHPVTGRTEVFDRMVEPPDLDERTISDQVETDERDRPPQEVAR